MKWRVVLELVGPDGTVVVYEVGGPAYAPQMIGLTLADGSKCLQGDRSILFKRRRRIIATAGEVANAVACSGPLRDRRSRQLVSLFGTVEVHAPRFGQPNTRDAWHGPRLSISVE